MVNLAITVKKIFVSIISAAIVSMVAIGGSTLATFLFYKLNGEQFGGIFSTSQVIGFLIIFILSFFFILFKLEKRNRT